MHGTHKIYKEYNGYDVSMFMFSVGIAPTSECQKSEENEWRKRERENNGEKSYIVIFLCSLLFEFKTRVEAWG